MSTCQSFRFLLAGTVTIAVLSGCGHTPLALTIVSSIPSADPGATGIADVTSPATLSASASPASALPEPATVASTAADLPATDATSSIPDPTSVGAIASTSASVLADPPLTAAELRALVPTMVTMSGDPKQPNDPADCLIPGDPVNVVVVGSQDQLDAAMLKSGWVHPASINVGSVIKMGWALLRGSADPTAPVSNLYLFGRKEDLAWETNSADVHHRDHCRGWKTTLKDGDGQDVWLISGAQDIGIEWDHRSHMTTHKISPNIDAERDLIVKSIEDAVPLKRVYPVPGVGNGHDFTGKNGGGDPYFTDGMMTVVEF